MLPKPDTRDSETRNLGFETLHGCQDQEDDEAERSNSHLVAVKAQPEELPRRSADDLRRSRVTGGRSATLLLLEDARGHASTWLSCLSSGSDAKEPSALPGAQGPVDAAG